MNSELLTRFDLFCFEQHFYPFNAYQEANKVAGCILQLGDRPINITLKRAIASLSWWQKLRLAWNILTNKVGLMSVLFIYLFLLAYKYNALY